MDRTVVYTDGACLGNPGPGGWAWAVPSGPFASGADQATTNQRMEIRAALEAVRSLPGPLEIVSDSTYVVNCFRDRWWEQWLARGWMNKARKPVANRDLWEPLVDLVRADPTRVRFRWVKGHSNDPVNDLVDRLAVEAAKDQTGRTGTGTPQDLGPQSPALTGRSGPGDDPRVRLGGGTPDAPTGHRLVVTGHRPPELGGYQPNPTLDRVRARLAEVLTAKAKVEPDLVVLSGLSLGAEQLGAQAALDAGVPYVAVLPYPDHEAAWPPDSAERYRELLARARSRIVLQPRSPETRQQAGAALRRRDDWLARNAHEAVVVWDGEDRVVARLVRSLTDAIGEEDVWIISPDA